MCSRAARRVAPPPPPARTPTGRAARVDDPPIGADEDESLRPRRERRARTVVHLVEQKRQAEPEALRRLAGLLPPLQERRLLIQDGILLEVCGKLPLVGGMRFGDVDEREVGLVAKALEEILDVARPATKGRSGEAAEDEQQRAPANELRQFHRLEVVGAPDGHGRQRVS